MVGGARVSPGSQGIPSDSIRDRPAASSRLGSHAAPREGVLGRIYSSAQSAAPPVACGQRMRKVGATSDPCPSS